MSSSVLDVSAVSAHRPGPHMSAITRIIINQTGMKFLRSQVIFLQFLWDLKYKRMPFTLQSLAIL